MPPLGRRTLLAGVFFLLPLRAADLDGVAPEAQAALSRITADALRGHVSFLASDALEGRGTPSRGLDIAAEYIASQFRGAGLEPLGDEGFFQTARFLSVEPVTEGIRLSVSNFGDVDAKQVSVDAVGALSLHDAEVVKGVAVAGKVLVVYAADFRAAMTARRDAAAAKPAAIVITGPGAARMRSARPMLVPEDDRNRMTPVFYVRDEKIAEAVRDAAEGPLELKINAEIPAPRQTDVRLRNVVAILRGSDPALRDTYELVTAHYDHLGMRGDGDDRVFNGANDDASGTASVISIASALAGMNPRPKRSIVFVALFGEELGLLGSRYYGAHPLVPLARTIADINLEHLGRTDSSVGPHVGMVNFTGHDYSDIPSIFTKAGERVGVRVEKDARNTEQYFARSDNQALADLGVPAHTVSVSYEFPDYHKVGDEWPKLDYDNMARVDRMIALGLLEMAGNPEPPHWNEAEPKAKKYVDAGRKLNSR